MKHLFKKSCIVAGAAGLWLGGLSAPARAEATLPDSGIPETVSTDFKLPERPFLMLSPDEAAAAKKKIQDEAWAGQAMKEFLADVAKINANPNLFPTEEGGWGHLYISPDTGATLQFDPEKPHEHFCPETKKYYTGASLDAAWRTDSMDLTAEQQQKLAAAYLLTADKKYAETMKRVFLNIADKYSKYRLHDRSMTHFGDQAEPIAGIATSQSIEECNLLTSLAFSYDTLAGSGVLSPEEKAEIEGKLWKRGIAYMYRIMALHPSGGNWWIWHACGATVLGVTFGDQKLVSLGLNTPGQGILSMFRAGYVNDDGFTGELSPAYHLYPFRALIRMALATSRVGIDFYKLPRFKRMFDLPIKISFPNLYMPRLNDGAEGCLISEEWASNYELAFHWYQDPAYGRLLHAIYAAGRPPPIGTTEPGEKVERDNINALFYGLDLPDDALSHADSSFLPGSGLSILRSPLNDWNCILKNDQGKSGHRHPDALNFILYANGDEAFPGTGSPHYGSPYYIQWFSQTIAHNTVTLNTHSQVMSPKGKEVEFGLSQGGLAAVQASAANVQGKAIGDACPVLLRRTVVMTPHAIVDIFRVTPNGVTAENLPAPPPVNLIDWALHLNGDLSIEDKTEKSQDALIPADRLNAASGGHGVPHQGYKFIHDLQEITSPGVIHGTLAQPLGGKIDFWLSPREASSKVYQAVGVGLETSMDKGLPMLIQRRSTNETAFTAVYAPYRENPQVQSVRFISPSPEGREVAAEITHQDGKDLVLSLPDPGSEEAAGASLKGRLGCRSELKDGGEMLLLVGEDWKDDDLELSLKTSGLVVLTKKDAQVQIYNRANAPIEGEIKIKSLSLDKSFMIQPQSNAIYSGSR